MENPLQFLGCSSNLNFHPCMVQKVNFKRPIINFKKVHLKPGASAKVEFALTVSDFQFYDEESGEWKLEPGIFDIILGSSSRYPHSTWCARSGHLFAVS